MNQKIIFLILSITQVINGKQTPLLTNIKTSNVYRFEPIQIVEEPSIGTLIIDLASKLEIHDLATSDYKFRFYSPHSLTAHYFLIDQLTGHVKTQRSLDREYLCETKACGPCTATNNCTLPIEIVAQQSNSFKQQKFVSFDVIIEDKNEFAPKFPRDSIVLNISENAPINFTVPIDAAIDRDSKQSKIVYKLVPIAVDDRFDESEIERLNSRIQLSVVQQQQQSQQQTSQQQLSLTILKPFDYEIEKEFSFKILASDSVQTINKNDKKNTQIILTGVCLVTIKVIDLNDNIPVFDKQEYEYRLDEDKALSGTKLIRVHATDKDDNLNGLVKYYFVDQMINLNNPSNGLLQQQQQSHSIRNIFHLDELTGWISVATNWNYLDYEQSSVYRLTVRAQDNGVSNSMPVYTSVTIYLNDVNDNAPQISLTLPSTLDDFSANQPNSQINTVVNQLEISEWTPTEQFLAQIVISDLDSGLNGKIKLDMTQFKKKTNQENWLIADDFVLVHLFNNIYSLMTKHQLDREKFDLYSLNITVTDYGQPFSLSTSHKLVIKIKDENDNPPQFIEVDYATTKTDKNGTAIAYEFNLFESVDNKENWIIIGRVKAIDQDINENAVIKYELDGNTNTTNLFRIDPETGLIRAKNYAIDRELTDLYELKVIASDYVNQATTNLIIKIMDLNDNKPVFEHHTYQFKVKESDPAFSRFGNVKALDADKPGTNYSLIKYSMQDDSNIFRINEFTGDLYLQSELDYEKQTNHELRIIATDGGSLTSSMCLVQIEVIDVNDNRPILLTPTDSVMPLIYSIEALPNTPYLFTLNATDLDRTSHIYGRIKFILDDEIQIDESKTNDDVINLFDCDLATGQVRLKLNDYELSEIVGIYALVFKITDNGGLTTNAYIFVVFSNRNQTNDPNYSQKIAHLRKLINEASLNSFNENNEFKFKRLIKQLNSPIETAELITKNQSNQLDRFKMQIMQAFNGKNYKYFLMFIISASVMIGLIILILSMSICFYRKNKKEVLIKKKTSSSSSSSTYGVILTNGSSASPASSITSSELIDNSNFLNTSATNSDENFTKKYKTTANKSKRVNIYSQKSDEYYYDDEDDEDGFGHLKKMASLQTESSNGLSTKSPSQQSSTASLIRINRFKKTSSKKSQMKRLAKNQPNKELPTNQDTTNEQAELLSKQIYDSNLNTSGDTEERSLMLNTNSPTATSSSSSSVIASLLSTNQQQLLVLAPSTSNSMYTTTSSASSTSNRNKMVASTESLASLNSLIATKTTTNNQNLIYSSRSSTTSQELSNQQAKLINETAASPNSFRTFKINYSSPNRQNQNSYRTMPVKTNGFDQKALNLPVNELFKRYELKKQGANTNNSNMSSGSISSSLHSSLSSLPQNNAQQRKIVEINIKSNKLQSSNVVQKQLDGNNQVPDYFFKDEKEYKKFLVNQNKLNCKHVIETETNNSDSNNKII